VLDHQLQGSLHEGESRIGGDPVSEGSHCWLLLAEGAVEVHPAEHEDILKHGNRLTFGHLVDVDEHGESFDQVDVLLDFVAEIGL
jgi:hypothetical protein